MKIKMIMTSTLHIKFEMSIKHTYISSQEIQLNPKKKLLFVELLFLIVLIFFYLIYILSDF